MSEVNTTGLPTHSASSTAPAGGLSLKAAAPKWIWAVLAAVLALIVGLATGMAVKSDNNVPPLPTEATAAGQANGLVSDPPVTQAAKNNLGNDVAPAKAPVRHHAKANNTHQTYHDDDRHVASSTVRDPVPAAAPICSTCGVVESVAPVKHRGTGSGAGAVAGGVVGGLLGNQMGKGSGNAAMTVLGAVGGGFAGNAIEKEVRASTVYQIRVRMDDGSVRTFERPTAIAQGSQVRVEGSSLRVEGNAQ